MIEEKIIFGVDGGIASFQIAGNIDVDKNVLKINVTIGRITYSISLIKLIGILSAPTELLLISR